MTETTQDSLPWSLDTGRVAKEMVASNLPLPSVPPPS